VIAILSGHGNVQAQGMPPTLVVTDTVTSMEFHEQITLVGRSEGAATSAIVSEVTGQVAAIVAPEGNPIKKSAGLIQIDPDRLKLELAAKEGEVNEAQELAELWAREKKRGGELFAKNLIREVSRDSTYAWANICQARYLRLSTVGTD
jgi:multidrug efflux pump subunit AcrA (membrane-fusion protein)